MALELECERCTHGALIRRGRVLRVAESEPARRGAEELERFHVLAPAREHGLARSAEAAVAVPAGERVARRHTGERGDDDGTRMRSDQLAGAEHRVIKM